MASRSASMAATEADLSPALARHSRTRCQMLVPLEWPRDASSHSDRCPRRGEANRITVPAAAFVGTTGLQKAVVLSHRHVIEHVNAYGSFRRSRPATAS